MAAIKVELIGVSAAQQLLESTIHSCNKAINREYPGLVFSLSLSFPLLIEAEMADPSAQ